MTQIERRQARIRQIRSHLNHGHTVTNTLDPEGATPDTEATITVPSARYHIGKTQNNPEYLIPFIQKNEKDPAIKASLEHLLNKPRIVSHGFMNLEFSSHAQAAPSFQNTTKSPNLSQHT